MGPKCISIPLSHILAVFSQNAKGHAFGDVICTNGAILQASKSNYSSCWFCALMDGWKLS
eukprot:scaffold164531_cov21-Tisochrysis_lutea.AAC.2